MEKDTEAFILEAHFLVLPLVTESHHVIYALCLSLKQKSEIKSPKTTV